MGVALVIRDLATPLKGLGLIILLWVRWDTVPAQGERLFSLAMLCTHCTADDFFSISFWEVSAVQPYWDNCTTILDNCAAELN